MEKKTFGKNRGLNPMKKQYAGLIAVLILVLAVVLSFIIYHQFPFMNGKKIILATQPIDPFDPFMGQYMRINYEISRVNNTENFNAGDSIYVSLKEDEFGIWRKESSSRLKPAEGDFIKGEVRNIYGNIAVVEYGIEQFFFERGANLPTRNITVEAVVDNSGRAKLVGLFKDGTPIKIEYKEFDIKA